MSRFVRVCMVNQMVEKPDPENEDEMIEVAEEVPFYFHHWGLTAGAMTDQKGEIFTGSWTVAICEHIETGQIHTFIPEYLRFVGYATPVKKEFKHGGKSED